MKNNLKKFTKTYINGFIPLLLISFLIILSGVYSCSSNMYSVQDDVTLGQEIDQQIKSDMKQFPVLQGHKEVKDYISGLGNYVLNNSPYIKYKSVFRISKLFKLFHSRQRSYLDYGQSGQQFIR